MTAKEYLNQARHIDLRIDSKLETIERLNSLANKATSTLSDMPGSTSRDPHKREALICKIIDLEHSVETDIDTLVDLKSEIMSVIGDVDDEDCQIVLERRYICMDEWKDIADEMNYDERTVYRIHGKALGMIKIPESYETCQ